MEEKLSAWTVNDINKLSQCYTKGMAIKEIARILDRTPTALHKAIARYNLHALNPSRKQNKMNEQGLPVPKQNEVSEPSYLKKLFEKCLNEVWVDFRTVLEYLKEHDIKAEALKQYNECKEELYSVDRKIFVASQILLIANRIRVQDHLPPFKVHELSF